VWAWHRASRAAATNLLRIPPSGPPANAVTRAYHAIAMPGNRTRVPADWTLNVAWPPTPMSFGLISSEFVLLDPDKPLG
jgi:NADH:ubiquinone reductase (H+-translocating)